MSGAMRETRLWARLRDAGVASGEPPGHADVPWYLTVLTGIAAWVAALFAFVFAIDNFSRLWSEPWRAFVVGAVGAVLRWTRGRVFAEQLAVAISLAGQLLMGLGLTQGLKRAAVGDMDWLAALAIAAIALSLYLPARQSLHRFLCGGIFAAGLLAACTADMPAMRPFAAPLLAWLALAAWWRSEAGDRFAPVLSPLAWALGLVALLAAGFVDLADWRFESLDDWAPWLRPLGDAAMVPLLPVCAFWLSCRQAGTAAGARGRLIALALVMALLWWRAPGVSVGAMLALVGFGLHRSALLVVGLCGIGGALLRHYFQLDTTLLEKSGWLLAAGATLLLVRVAAHRLRAAGASR